MKTEIWYNIQNGGDGSVHLRWFESKELARIDEEHMDEGWGEPSYRSIVIIHDSQIELSIKPQTLDQVIKEVEEELKETWYSSSYKKTLQEKLEALEKLKEKKNENKT